MSKTWSLYTVVMLFILTFGSGCLEKMEKSNEIPSEAQVLLDKLNDWDKDELDVVECPNLYPDYKSSRETHGWVIAHKRELKKLEFAVKWNHEKKIYELQKVSQQEQRMLIVSDLIKSQNHLTFYYEVKNVFEHDIWVCDDMYVFSNEKVETEIEKDVVFIRLRFNFPYSFFYDEMVARYIRVSPMSTHSGKITIELPIGDLSHVPKPSNNYTQNILELDHVIFEVGYFGEDLKEKVYEYIKRNGQKVRSSEYSHDMADKLKWLNEKNDVNNVLCAQYLWEGIKQEQALSTEVRGVAIPCCITRQE